MYKKMKSTALNFLSILFLVVAFLSNTNLQVKASETNGELKNASQVSSAEGFINMSVPEVWSNSQGDINIKLSIINLKDFSKADIFINDNEKPFKTVSEITTETTSIKLPLNVLNRAKNKVVLKAYSKTASSKIYMQTKYINIVKSDDISNTSKLSTNSKASVKVNSTITEAESDSYSIKVWSPTNTLPYELQIEVNADEYTNSYYMDLDGYVRIPKADIDGKSNVRLRVVGDSSDGVFVYSNRQWTSNLSEIRALTTTKKLPIKDTNPITDSKLVSGMLRIYGNINNYSYLQNIYSVYINDDIRAKISNNSYSFWCDEDSTVQLNMDMKFSDNKQYSLWTDIIDTKISTNIAFDEKKISKIVLVPQVAGKYDGATVSLSKNVDDSYDSDKAYEYYVSKGSYKNAIVQLETKDDINTYYSYFTKDNYTISDDITYIGFGGNITFKAVGGYNDGSKEVYLGMINIMDEYGNKFDSYGNVTAENMTAYLYDKSGKVVFKGKPNDDLYLNISSVPEGIYDVVVELNNKELGVIKSQPSKLVTEGIYEINLFDSKEIDAGYDGYRYSLYDENNKEIYNGQLNTLDIPRSLVDTSKKYKLYVLATYTNFSTNDAYQDGFVLNDISFGAEGQMQSLYIDSSTFKCLTLKDDFYKNTIMQMPGNLSQSLEEVKEYYSNSSYNLKGIRLQKGLNYNFYTNRVEQGSQYFLYKKYTPNDTDTTISFDKNNISKLNVSNGINSTVNNVSLNLKGSNGQLFNVNLAEGNNVYLTKDTYASEVAFNLTNSPYRVRATYNINATSDITDFKIGASIKLPSVKLSDTTIAPGGLLSSSVGDIYDGTILLKDLNKAIASSGLAPSLELMHGNKVIKSYKDGKIPATVGGETNFRLNFNDILPGLITNVATVSVTNATLDNKIKCDINLDGTIDIFDIVYVAKDIDKTKALSSDWDPRCNLNNLDGQNKIDMLDVAELAKNYR
ncbi:hypothetical protein JHL18_24980 [Clostridium sp. YIM B02505]|uniref:Dockerin domain-containing protein n=1 Tax=Clostridium yunnanense TaxID=2800325 RepID=A0ABS1EWV2_9CLOT|nr:hypothetical protein [Clostridium yunnanense]MBK1813864.1 hypothetical protein [Clostridium yunnanense]